MAAYGSELGIDLETLLKIGSSFGGGMGRTGSTCGTVTGALIVIGLKEGFTSPKEPKEKVYGLADRFMREFKERCGASECRDLIGIQLEPQKKLSKEDAKVISERCPGFLKNTIEILDSIM